MSKQLHYEVSDGICWTSLPDKNTQFTVHTSLPLKQQPPAAAAQTFMALQTDAKGTEIKSFNSQNQVAYVGSCALK